MTRKIVLTGGGTAGHVTPNIALIHCLNRLDWQCFYIGSKQGIEKELITVENVQYHAIASGKLRRYFSWQNFIDPFNVFWGIIQSYRLLSRIKPEVVFSKGGFVALPVVIAAWLKRIPIIAHESDLSPGLTTKLSQPFAKNVCVTFEKAKQFFKAKQKVIVTGTPIRASLLDGDKEKARTLCYFDNAKPCLLIMGGGLGSMAINQIVRKALPTLLKQYNVIHICGKGKSDRKIQQQGYCQFEYVKDELADLFALADLVISRSGANSVYEILSLNKPHIFIPLPLKASRGDQIHNANYFKSLGISDVLDEDTLTPEKLIDGIKVSFENISERSQKIKDLNFGSGTENVLKVVENVANQKVS